MKGKSTIWEFIIIRGQFCRDDGSLSYWNNNRVRLKLWRGGKKETSLEGGLETSNKIKNEEFLKILARRGPIESRISASLKNTKKLNRPAPNRLVCLHMRKVIEESINMPQSVCGHWGRNTWYTYFRGHNWRLFYIPDPRIHIYSWYSICLIGIFALTDI